MFRKRKTDESDALVRFHENIVGRLPKKSKKEIIEGNISIIEGNSAIDKLLKDITTLQDSNVISNLTLPPKYKLLFFSMNLISFFGFLMWYMISDGYYRYWDKGGWVMAFFPIVCVLIWTGGISFVSMRLEGIDMSK